MACTRPLYAYKKDGAVVVLKGRGGVPGDESFRVPCGQCGHCRLRAAQDWAIRCMHEAQTSEAACFITLTYDEDNRPEDWSINKKHFQDFAKRLRKRVGPFRYLACGEYGDESSRPHYHAILFGVDFSDDREIFQRNEEYNIYVSPTLTQAWGKGFASVGDCTFESCAYVARYTMKKQGMKVRRPGDPAWYPNAKYRRTDMSTGEEWYVVPEFALSSRAYGLGTDWFHRYWSDVFPADRVIVSGRELRPPAFYDKLAESLASIDMDAIREQRRCRAESIDQSRERLEVKERWLEAKKLLKSCHGNL